MAYEFESELEDEFEGELEGETEEEMEDEGEGEGWLGALGNIAGSLLGESEGEDEYEGEGELEGEDELEGEGWLGTLGNIAGSLLGESEGEDEYEDEGESEEELSPIRKIYPDAMMEHLGQLASEAESEDEAVEHFLPLIGMAASKLLPVVARAVAPMAKRALPKIARAITRATPHLTKSIGKVTRTLHRNPATRHLLKTVPSIARRTVGSIARQAVHGRRVTPRAAIRTLAKQTRRVLGHPGHRKHALRRHNYLERRFHRGVGRGTSHPQGRYGRRWRYGRYPRGYSGRRMVGGGGTVRPTGPGYVAPRGVTPRAATPGGAVRVPGYRPGRVVGGQCSCAPCPTCGTPAAAHTTPTPTPAYCRCCGQVIR